jgi:hypothetical protein
MNLLPNKNENVLNTIKEYKDTWAPKHKDVPMLAVLDSVTLLGLGKVERELLLEYFSETRKRNQERLRKRDMGINGFTGKYTTLTKMIKKGFFISSPKTKEVILNPNVVSPRVIKGRFPVGIVEKSKLNVHPYTGAIVNKEYFIHYDLLELMTEFNKAQNNVLLYFAKNLDVATNSFQFNLSTLAKTLKVRVGVVKEVLKVLSESNMLIYISDFPIKMLMPSRDYHIMLNPRWFIKSMSNYVAFRYAFNFFSRVIATGYPINAGVFNIYVGDSVTSVKKVKALYNKAHKTLTENNKKLTLAYKEGTHLDLAYIETEFIKIKEEYINTNY